MTIAKSNQRSLGQLVKQKIKMLTDVNLCKAKGTIANGLSVLKTLQTKQLAFFLSLIQKQFEEKGIHNCKLNYIGTPRWRKGRAFASHAGDRGSIPGRDRPKSNKRPLGHITHPRK